MSAVHREICLRPSSSDMAVLALPLSAFILCGNNSGAHLLFFLKGGGRGKRERERERTLFL